MTQLSSKQLQGLEELLTGLQSKLDILREDPDMYPHNRSEIESGLQRSILTLEALLSFEK